jgi:hypothetical protein
MNKQENGNIANEDSINDINQDIMEDEFFRAF